MTSTTPAPTHAPLTGALTFRKDAKQTGLASIVRPHPDTAIRIDGRQVGTIHAPTPRGESQWSISLMVVDPDAHCGWSRVRMTRRYDDEPSARLAIRGGDTTLRARHNLHAIKD